MHRILFIILSLALGVSAQETLMRQVLDTATDTHVEVLALFSKAPPGGYLPVRVKIANNLPSNGFITLSFDSSSNNFGNGGLHAKSTFDFEARGRQVLTRDILVPLVSLSPKIGATFGAGLKTSLSGSFGDALNSLTTNDTINQPSVLLSEALFTPNASTLDAAMTGPSRHGRNEFAAKFDPKQLPDSWLAFSGYDTLIMTDTDWTATPAGSRNAILSWMRLGGQLIIFSVGNTNAKALGIPDEYSLGSVVLVPVSSSLKLDPKSTIALVSKNPNPPRNKSLRVDFSSNWPLQNRFGSQAFRYGFFIIVLVFFAIVVGPINLFIFAKSGQRHKLFITTPIISIVASGALMIFIVVQDGFGGSGIRRILMEVRPDGDQNAAYIEQEQFVRTGVLLGSDFALAEPALLAPVPIAATRWARYTNSSTQNGDFSLQPADAKIEASGDWFKSRSEHGNTVSTVSSTRGRIEATETPGTYLSTFDFPIETLFLKTESGWNRADQITTGKRFTLTETTPAVAEKSINAEINDFSNRNGASLKRLSQRAGCFVALTHQAPGIDTHPGIKWKETRTVITGPILVP